MSSAQTVSESPTNEMEVLKKMEDEHLRLQRQVRIIQTDRLHRSMGVHPQFRKQDKLLRVLKKEYVNLIKDLKIARSGAHKKKDQRMKKNLKNSLIQMMMGESMIDEGVTMMRQLDNLVQRDNHRMLHMRKLNVATKGQLQDRQYQSENRLVSTENQLETAMLRFNTIQYENKKVREEIEHMLKDRELFNQAWLKMLNALSKGKKFLTDLFESSTVAYDQRDEWCAKLRSLIEKGKMDQKLQVQEMRDLQKTFDHDMKVHDFLYKKGLIRINKKQEKREEEQKIKKKEDVEKQIDQHVKILEDVYVYTRESSADKIIETAERVEQENMSIYKLLTDVCAESVVLKKDISRIRQEIVDRKDWNERKEEQRGEHLEELKRDLDEVTKRTNELRKQNEEKDNLIKNAMATIEEIFKMLDCSYEPFQNLLGDKVPSIWNFNLTMCLITDKIKELIHTVYYFERHINKKKENILFSTSRLKKYTIHADFPRHWSACPITLIVPADPCPTCIEARWLSRVSETPEVPFNKAMALAAVAELANDPAFERYDRIHAITDCRLPHSRAILAKRYL